MSAARPVSVRELAMRPPVRREKDEERLGDQFMAALCYEAVRFSQPRNTMQSPGIPDRKYYNVARGWTLWWEAKAANGKQSAAQRRFQSMAEACGEAYVCGPLEALVAYIRGRARQPSGEEGR